MARLIDADKLTEKLLHFACRLEDWNRPEQSEVVRTVAKGIKLETTVEVPKWIPVTERLPEGEDGKILSENVIAYLNNGEVEEQVCPGWLNGDKWYLLANDMDYHTVWGLGAVTHWQPMPQPPKEE